MFLVAFYGFFRVVGELTIKIPERRHSVLQFQTLSFLKSRSEVQAAKLVISGFIFLNGFKNTPQQACLLGVQG